MQALAQAENPRALDRLHNDVLKGDLSGPLVTQILAILGE
jgi:hypothetical protein